MNGIGELARGVVMAGIKGTAFDETLPQFGGYMLFGEADAPLYAIRALTDALRERAAGLPPLIAIDQEGGRVARLHRDVEPMPSMMALGAAGELDLTRRAGEQIAFDLRRAGCALDFAPVLDLALEPGNRVIGTRSFGADPQQVASLGAAFGVGLAGGGVFPCYKHFPGHGSTATDSHDALPLISTDEVTLRARDLVPFAHVARNAAVIMTAHVVVPAFDGERPATTSTRVLTGLLREELGFQGVLVTDCLQMQAIAAQDSVSGAVDAFAAGADLLLFSHDVAVALAAAAAVEEAVDAGRIPLARLQEAHRRVANLRAAAAAPLPLDAFPPHRGVGREIARRAITVVRGIPHADPLASVAVSFGGTEPELKREAAVVEELIVPSDPADADIAFLLDGLAQRGRRPLVLARRAHLHPAQAGAIAQILERYPDALVVSLLEPFDVPLFASARHLLAAYGDDEAAIGGLADVIFGSSLASGRLPVSLDT
ncbi:MAG: glycoside hydrolase family 3 protein [Candidatus Eremiobacteraeota bacterium]|nr:glycoside hydrolase family 3 protein [Candidatus Eremiobacteraeota bacterium]